LLTLLADIEPNKFFENLLHALETAEGIDSHVFLLVRMIVKVKGVRRISYLEKLEHSAARQSCSPNTDKYGSLS